MKCIASLFPQIQILIVKISCSPNAQENLWEDFITESSKKKNGQTKTLTTLASDILFSNINLTQFRSTSSRRALLSTIFCLSASEAIAAPSGTNRFCGRLLVILK